MSVRLCTGTDLQVCGEPVRVGHGKLIDSLLPIAGLAAFNEPLGLGGSLSSFFGAAGSSTVFDVTDHQPQCLDSCGIRRKLDPVTSGFTQLTILDSIEFVV